MHNTNPTIPLIKSLGVLIGFPVVSTLISLLLLNRSVFSWSGVDFFIVFWIIIIGWYLLQTIILTFVLRTSGWDLSQIGFSFSKKKTLWFIFGYLAFSFGLLVFIEIALANSPIDTEKLRSLSSLTPKTTPARIIFILMGLVAGLTEELVYRGFAVRVLESYGINKWLAVVTAAIPFVFQHGLKSLDQFWWFFIWGLVFGVMFIFIKKLYIGIAIHWLIILSAMVAVLQVIR